MQRGPDFPASLVENFPVVHAAAPHKGRKQVQLGQRSSQPPSIPNVNMSPSASPHPLELVSGEYVCHTHECPSGRTYLFHSVWGRRLHPWIYIDCICTQIRRQCRGSPHFGNKTEKSRTVRPPLPLAYTQSTTHWAS